MPELAKSLDKRVSGLLDLARSDPVAVLERGRDLISELTDPDAVAVASRAMSIAARNGSSIEESIEFGRAAVESAEDDTLRRECTATLSSALAISGDTAAALDVLNEASDGAEGLIAGQLEFQKGFIHTQMGEYDKALSSYARALPTLRSHGSDLETLLLKNEGYIYLQLGRLDEAETRLSEVRAIEESAGRHMEVSGTDHNLGVLASYRGDIPEALRRFTMSDDLKAEQTGDHVPHHVSRCEVLLTAGLAREAFELAIRIAGAAGDQGRSDDAADAQLLAARAASQSGHHAESQRLARAAADRFEEQGRRAWIGQARLVLVEARYEIEGATEPLLTEAAALAESLEEAGFVVAAARAHLLSGRVALALGDKQRAQRHLKALAEEGGGPVELRVQRYLARALLREAAGDNRGADAAARAGLDVLDQYQAGLGSSDLRFGIERQGAELGAIGLRLARESSDARRLLRWMDRTRARALRHIPVVPEDDAPDQQTLEELRRVGAELRESPDDRSLIRRRRRLQEELRNATRARRGADGTVSLLDLGHLVEVLGDRSLLEIAVLDGRLAAVEIRQGRFRRHDIGDASAVESELARLRFDLRRTARLSRNPERVVKAVSRFDEMLFGRLPEPSSGVVVVPPGSLMAIPWSVLPSLRDTTVTVSPSAEMWLKTVEPEHVGSGVVLAAGPDLENSVPEVARLADLYGFARVLGPENDTGEFGSSVRGAAVAHAACHASFEVENPMFSSLRLGDGDFNVYDMERLGRPPDLMVLSACDSGYSDTGAGDELTGLTSALLSMGSRAVVASIGLVPDSTATSDLMYRFHAHLKDGSPPAVALARATSVLRDDPECYIAAASFICVGGG